MRKTVAYVGLDTAKMMGVAIYVPSLNVAVVDEFQGSPPQQLGYLRDNILNRSEIEPIFVMERIHNFFNANTTRSLLERYGYLKYSLKQLKVRVEEVSPKEARKALGVKEKVEVYRKFLPYYGSQGKITDNHTDALAIAIHQAILEGEKEPDYDTFVMLRNGDDEL